MKLDKKTLKNIIFLVLFFILPISAQTNKSTNDNYYQKENVIVDIKENVIEIKNLLNKNGYLIKQENENFIIKKEGLRYLKSINAKYNAIGINFIASNTYKESIEDELYSDNNTQLNALASPISGGNGADVPIPDYSGGNPGYADSRTTISSAPSSAIITKVTYKVRVLHTFPGDLDIALNHENTNVWIWQQYGASDDGGFDDDTESDEDIYLNWSQNSSRETNDFNDTSSKWSMDASLLGQCLR